MKALVFGKKPFVTDVDNPRRKKGSILIRVVKAGICNTDHEILKGYIPGFTGIPGHEFIGYVEEADDRSWIGKRVTAEINCACGLCEFCQQGLQRHCPERTVIGIVNRSGAFAEYISVPEENVHAVPAEIADNDAIFIEPLAAALEVVEQTPVTSATTALVVGDGKLGILVGLVLQKSGCSVTLLGKHEDKLKLAKSLGVKRTVLLSKYRKHLFDLVVEASGSPSAFELAVASTKPRGTLVLKSTYARNVKLNPAPIVVNEIRLIGSRCGRFPAAIKFILQHKPPLHKLISATFPLSKALQAFKLSANPETLKVVIEVAG